jgi:hypothetical protein
MAITQIPPRGIEPGARRPVVAPIIINGDMAVAQRSTSVSGDTAGGYLTCDRIRPTFANIGTYTFIQESLTTGDAFANGFTKAFRLDCTTADASPAAADYFYVSYKIEGNNLQVFKKGTANAQKMTLSFWVKSNKTGTAQVNMNDQDNTRMCSGTYTISSADTWEKKIINIAADTTGAFDNDNANSMQIEWWLDGGSNFQGGAVPTAWEARSNTDRGVSDLAIADNTANDWAITGIQLEVGEFDSDNLPSFQYEGYGDSLFRCQRYAYVITGDNEVLGFGFGKGSDNVVGPIIFPTTMRSAPTTTTTTVTTGYKFQGSQSDGTGQDQNINGANNILEQAGTRGITYKMADLSSVGGGSTGFFRTNSASAHIKFDSEL